MKKPGKKSVEAWGGYLNGRLDTRHHAMDMTELYAVFRTRKNAAQYYTDVRRVTITEK